jgi:hypothetical protein
MSSLKDDRGSHCLGVRFHGHQCLSGHVGYFYFWALSRTCTRSFSRRNTRIGQHSPGETAERQKRFRICSLSGCRPITFGECRGQLGGFRSFKNQRRPLSLLHLIKSLLSLPKVTLCLSHAAQGDLSSATGTRAASSLLPSTNGSPAPPGWQAHGSRSASEWLCGLVTKLLILRPWGWGLMKAITPQLPQNSGGSWNIPSVAVWTA